MSETAAASSTPATPAAESTAPAAATKTADTKTETSTWDATREAKLLEEFKASPFAKFRANGKDETIDSVEKLKAVMLDASRGRGASKVAEEAKREKAEALAVKQRAELLEKALDGDDEALAALGRQRPEVRQQREKALAEIPPEVRQLLEELEATRAENAKFAAEREQAKKAEEERRVTAKREQVRTEALGFAKSIVEAIGDGAESEQVLPYVLRAWSDLTSEGLQANVDVTAEQVVSLARQLYEQDGVGRVEKLAPKSFLGAALKRLESMPAKEVVAGFSPKMRVAIARELAQAKAAAKAAPPPAAAQPKSEEPLKMAQPLGAFRFSR